MKPAAFFALLLTACASSPSRPEFKTNAFSVRVVGEGRPVILIPGLTCGGDVWNTTVERYKSKCELHVLTLAGFAGQPPIPPPFLKTVRDEIIRYAREKHLKKPVVVGHSLGGFMALWIASTDPDDVGAVVAVDGVPFFPGLFDSKATAAGAEKSAAAMRDAYAKMTPDEFAAGTREFLGNMITKPADLDAVLATSSKSDPATVGQAMYELLTTDIRDEVAKVKAPVLLIASGAMAPNARARETTLAQYEAQVAAIPTHRTVMAEKARHFIMLDDPAFFFEMLDRFLVPLRM